MNINYSFEEKIFFQTKMFSLCRSLSLQHLYLPIVRSNPPHVFGRRRKFSKNFLLFAFWLASVPAARSRFSFFLRNLFLFYKQTVERRTGMYIHTYVCISHELKLKITIFLSLVLVYGVLYKNNSMHSTGFGNLFASLCN